MKDFDTKNDNGGAWINFYKLPNKEIYWSGSVGYSTKEIAQYNNAGECYRIATLNIKEVLNQQAEINWLRETLIRINTLLSENIRPCIFKNATTVSVPIVTLERLTAIIRHSLNREREGKND